MVRWDRDLGHAGTCLRENVDRGQDQVLTLLPDPDSPSSASTEPLSSSNVTPLSARTTPSRVSNSTRRSRTLSSGMVPSAVGAGHSGARMVTRSRSCSGQKLNRRRPEVEFWPSPLSLSAGSCDDPRPRRLDCPPRPARPLFRRCPRQHRPTPSTDGPAPIGRSASAPPAGPHLLDLLLTALAELASQPCPGPPRHRRRLAPPGLPPLLALEVPTPLTDTDRRRFLRRPHPHLHLLTDNQIAWSRLADSTDMLT